jgi:lysophospholipase L1-like esterase
MTRAALAALVGALLVLEAALRLIGYSAPQWYELDPRLGWRLHPHRHGWFVAQGTRVPVHTTPAGFRDREHTLDKPDGVYRIAVLGDEHSEAMAVELRQAWWWQLPARLQECGFQPERLTEVLNFGVGGYGTAQEYVLLETTAMRYQPDLVLLQFSPNDVMDNSRSLTPRKDRPFFVLDAHGVPRIDDSFALAPSFDNRMQTRYRLAEEIADHSRTYQLGRQLAELAFIGEARADSPRFTEDAWRVTEAVIAKMNAFTRRNGAQLAVVAMGRPEQRLSAFGRQNGLPVFVLDEALDTAQAHANAARAVAQRLCRATAQPG